VGNQSVAVRDQLDVYLAGDSLSESKTNSSFQGPRGKLDIIRRL